MLDAGIVGAAEGFQDTPGIANAAGGHVGRTVQLHHANPGDCSGNQILGNRRQGVAPGNADNRIDLDRFGDYIAGDCSHHIQATLGADARGDRDDVDVEAK